MILGGALFWAIGFVGTAVAQNSTDTESSEGGRGSSEELGSSEYNYCGARQCYNYCKYQWQHTTVTTTTTKYVTISPSPTYCPEVPTVTKYVTITKNQTLTETTKTTTTTTDLETTTDYTTTTLTISYPYNVTVINSYGYPVYTTVWTTTTTTRRVYIPQPTTTTTTEILTIPRNDTITVPTTTTTTESTTEYTTSTYTTTRNVTIIETYPVTVVNNFTSYTTVTDTVVSTYNVTITYPITETTVTTTTEVVTTPTTTTATELVPTTATEVSVSVTTAVSVTEVVVTLDPSTITTTISGTPTTITLPGETVTSTLTLPPVTLPPVTLPASTITTVVTTVLPGVPTTITLDGTTVRTTLPGVTTSFTTTVTLPGSTVTQELLPLCPAPTNSGPVVPQDTGPNALWGCSPGYICNLPKPQGCALFADPPASDFLCDAKYCLPAPPFNEVVWPPNKSTYYPPPPNGYFNLNPKAFGLDYTIFTKSVIVTYTIVSGSRVLTTITSGKYESQASLSHYPPAAATHAPRQLAARVLHWLSKRDETIIPSVCYAACNNCYLEAQRVGKSPAICAAGSTFSRYRASCDACVEANGDLVKRSQQTYFNPRILEIVGFCDSPGSGPVEEPTTPAPPPVITSTSRIVQDPLPASTTSVEVVTEVAPTPIASGVELSTSTFTSTPAAVTPTGSSPTTSYQQVGPGGSAQPSASTTYLQNNPNVASSSLPSLTTLLTSLVVAICGVLFL